MINSLSHSLQRKAVSALVDMAMSKIGGNREVALIKTVDMAEQFWNGDYPKEKFDNVRNEIKNTDGSYITGWYKMNNYWYYMDRAGDRLNGWQNIDKTWYFLKSDGKMATGWQLINGTWYYLKDWGGMATGWLRLGNNWYFLKSNGMMATGWNWIGNKCYYFYTDGHMAANTTINGYKLGASGAWVR